MEELAELDPTQGRCGGHARRLYHLGPTAMAMLMVITSRSPRQGWLPAAMYQQALEAEREPLAPVAEVLLPRKR